MDESSEEIPRYQWPGILYEQCIATLQIFVQQMKSSLDWPEEDREAIKHNFARLILWGEDLSDGQLEICLMHSPSLCRGVLEVFTSLGNLLVEDGSLVAHDFGESYRLQASSMRSNLNQVSQLLVDTDSDNVSTIPELSSDGEDRGIENRANFVEELRHHLTLLFQFVPTIEALTTESSIFNDARFKSQLLELSSVPEPPTDTIPIKPDRVKPTDPTIECEECENMRSRTLAVWYCYECCSYFCDDCWERQIAHTKPSWDISSNKPLHEKVDPSILRILSLTFNDDEADYDQSVKKANEERSLWFEVRKIAEDQSELVDTGKLEAILGERHHQSSQLCYPSLVSFVGDTGSGKSALMSLLIQFGSLNSEALVPTVSTSTNTNATTSGVHLYYSPETLQEPTLVLYADTEGISAGQREPLMQSSMPALKSARKGNWADRPESQRSGFISGSFYPQVLYTLSDILICLTKDSRNVERMFEYLICWADSAHEASQNRPILPFAFIVLNSTDPEIEAAHWEVENCTESLLKMINSIDILSGGHFLHKTAQKWRSLGAPVTSMGSLFFCYYRGIKLIRLPLRSHPKLMYQQVQRLHAEIRWAVAASQKHNRECRMLMNASQFQKSFTSTLDHFAADLDTLPNLLTPSEQSKYSKFRNSICKLATMMMQALSEDTKGQAIFEAMEEMLASCIMLDAIRNDLRGTADVLFQRYSHSLDEALNSFCYYHWPCDFKRGSQRCTNSRAGHMEVHQQETGKFFATGPYQTSFRAADYHSTFKNRVLSTLRSISDALPNQATPGASGIEIAAVTHRLVVSRFYTHVGSIGNFFSRGACVSCLFGTPEHALQCHHILCAQCVKDYGLKQNGTRSVYRVDCPLHQQGTIKSCDVKVLEEAKSTGIRVLALDGGGIRCVIQLEFLRLIENNLGGSLLISSFIDLVVGSGTGGLIALGLGDMRWSTTECLTKLKALYHEIFQARGIVSRKLGSVFDSSSQSLYRSKPLDKALQSMFGSRKLFGDLPEPHSIRNSTTRVAVVATTTSGTSYIFTNYNRTSSPDTSHYKLYHSQDYTEELQLWEIARVTCATPLLFTPSLHGEKTFIGGSAIYNNPIQVADGESRLIWPEKAEKPPDLMLSIGSGYCKDSRSHPRADLTSMRSGFRDSDFPAEYQELLRNVTDHVQSSLDAEQTWLDFKKSKTGDQQFFQDKTFRYVRLNREIDQDLPRLDEVGQMNRLSSMIEQYLSSGKHFAGIKRIAADLLATSFYFEQSTDSPLLGKEQSLSVSGTILCRFEQGSDDIKRLGSALLERMIDKLSYRSAFTISSGNSGPTTKFELSSVLIADMIDSGQFSFNKVITVTTSADVPTSINLHIGDGREKLMDSPISGFPRIMVDEPHRSSFRKRTAATDSMNPRYLRRRLALKTLSPSNNFPGLTADQESSNALPVLDPTMTHAKPQDDDQRLLQRASTIDLTEQESLSTQVNDPAKNLKDASFLSEIVPPTDRGAYRCSKCGVAGQRRRTRTTNSLHGAGRTFYRCFYCDTFICFEDVREDMRNEDEGTPLCHCGQPSTRTFEKISRVGIRDFHTCSTKTCNFYEPFARQEEQSGSRKPQDPVFHQQRDDDKMRGKRRDVNFDPLAPSTNL